MPRADEPPLTASQLAEVAAGQASLYRLYNAISGTVNERAAQDFLATYEFQMGIRDCMQKRGLNYRPPAFAPLPTAESTWNTYGLFEVTTAIDPADGLLNAAGQALGYWPLKQSYGTPNPSIRGLSTEEKDAYVSALDECAPTAEAPAPEPEGAEAMASELSALVVAAMERAAPQLGDYDYGRCMKTAGFETEPDGRTTLLTGFRKRYGEILRQEERDLAAWARIVADERRAAVADSDCRRGAHDLVMRELSTTLPDFEAANERALSRLEDGWQGIRSRAEAAVAELPEDWFVNYEDTGLEQLKAITEGSSPST